MALLPLPLHTQSSYFTSKSHPYLHKSLLTKPKFTILSQESPSSKPTIEEQPTPSNSAKKTLSPRLGFGSGSGSGSGSAQLPKSNASGSKKQKGRGERSSTIRRRAPVETPVFLGKKGEELLSQEQSVSEGAFVIAWLGLGGLILVEGIALASSGFLPEQWDKLFVKFLYPSFTPTVFLFVAGSVVYGVFKYLQNESLRNDE